MSHRRSAVSGVLLVVAATLFFPYLAASAENDYVVIVHRQSAVAAVSKAELNNLYLKKTTKWKDGSEVQPVDLSASSPIRARFVQDVMGKNVAAVQAYWRKLIFAGQGVPPVELQHDGDVLNFVSNHKGAIGYVAATTFMDAAFVKKVKVTD